MALIFPPRNRRDETILTRLRIGHTNFTHGYLMSTPHEPVPICTSCNVRMSVEHFLVESREFARPQHLFLKENSLKEILSENTKFSCFNLFKFLKHCNLFDKI